MEKSFRIVLSEYKHRLKWVGILSIIACAVLGGVLNLSWNADTLNQTNKLLTPYLLILYFLLVMYIVFAMYIFEILLVRKDKVMNFNLEPHEYKITFEQEGIHLAIPCKEKQVFVKYDAIKYWGIRGADTFIRKPFTFNIRLKTNKFSKGQFSIYLNGHDLEEVKQACKDFAPHIKIRTQFDHPSAYILTLLDVTDPWDNKNGAVFESSESKAE